MKLSLLFVLVVSTACASSASAPAAAPTSVSAASSKPASTASAAPAAAPTSTSKDDTEEAPQASDDTDGASDTNGPLVDKPLPNTPFIVKVPSNAVLKAGDNPLEASIQIVTSNHDVTVMPRLEVIFMPLDEELKDLARQKMPVISKSGAGEEYSIVYKPFPTTSPNIMTYWRYMRVGGKKMQCGVEGFLGTDDLAVYEGICNSIRAKH